MKKFWLKFKKWILTILGISAITIVITFGGTTNDTTIAKLSEKYDKATEIKAEYVLDGATLKATPKDNPKDRIEVTIGNKPVAGVFGADANFEPTVTIARWDDEVNFTIKPKDFDLVALKDRTLKFDKEKIIFETPKVDYKLYELPISEDSPEGGFEYQVDLKEKPATNVIEFTLNIKGVEFFYQPELTIEEIAQGASRPENVIGSYAVYASEQKTNWEGGKLYRTGKVGHIYRPKIIDANGNWAWEELKIENGILTITIPQDFLDKAIYPISSRGVNWGNTALGASITSGWADRVNMVKATAPANGTIDSYSYGGKKTATGVGSFNCGLYVSDGSSLVTNSQSDEKTDVTTTKQFWTTLDSGSQASIVNGTAYVIACYVHDVEWAYDSAGTNMYTSYIGSYASTMPASVTVGANVGGLKASIYATYTAGGGGAVVEDPPQILITD